MKKIFILWLGFLIILPFINAATYNSTSTTIFECGNITAPGDYYLNQSFNASSNCLFIKAENVSIFGNGFEIIGNYSNTSAGILNYGNKNLRVNNLTIKNFGVGIYLQANASDSLFENLIIENTPITSLYIVDNSINNTFLNCVYESEYVGTTSQLIRQWYFDVNVKDQDENNLKDTNVTLFNSTTEIFSELTDEDGNIKQKILTGYVNTYGNVTTYLYYMNITKKGYETNESNFNITENKKYNVHLKDIENPVINLISPLDKTYTSNSLNLDFVFNVSDASKVEICILYLNGIEKSNITNISNPNTISLSGLTPDKYSWYVNCTDSANNTGKSSTGSFVIKAAGGGGGAYHGGRCVYDPNYDWGCSEWGECVNGVQTRTCKERNNCGTTWGRPPVTRPCTETLKEITPITTNETLPATPTPPKGFFATITGAVIGALGKTGSLVVGVFILIVVGASAFVVSKKITQKKKKQKTRKK